MRKQYKQNQVKHFSAVFGMFSIFYFIHFIYLYYDFLMCSSCNILKNLILINMHKFFLLLKKITKVIMGKRLKVNKIYVNVTFFIVKRKNVRFYCSKQEERVGYPYFT